MKKNKFITTLFLSCLTLSAGLLLNEQAFANPAETTVAPDQIITENAQKLTQIKEVKKELLHQKNNKNEQLANLEKKIKKIQVSLDQIEEIEVIGRISNPSKSDNTQMIKLKTELLPTTIQADAKSIKKEQLIELKQQETSLKIETDTLSKQQSETEKQAAQLSDKITQVEKQKTEQAKQTDTRTAIVAAAKTHLGKPYVYGAAGPDAFDCSGLVQVAFASAGQALGRTTVDQETAGTIISVTEAQAGDLVFWGSHGGTYHVGISTGDGSYIHAPVPGDVVQIATVASYAPDFAVRIL
ncbi:hypothetical protein BCR24_04570 [Enterococcus ureilyticus]|uniref:NlpC/P60 domain-containing protein n=1 Tax=Enterococcus ureilyticus TaxID=1131292 RepID=A0A1E5HAR0_9ENTE|nr:C40 family peptidase [Enterococcus ureilyticus]MBM7688869.1 cell wall-associated NlpC family hydrolase [Enterococcus ureilyticus]OEG21983.1 hypothetical protein BCR24_04570 [Enterococcus ureilyticus]